MIVRLLLCSFILLMGCVQSKHARLSTVKAHYKHLEKLNKNSPQSVRFISEADDMVEDYDKLSQIILVRHGEPDLDKAGRRSRRQAMDYIIAYDTVGVVSPKYAPVVIDTNELKIIHTSSIARARSTSSYLFNRPDIERPDSLFREFERKVFGFPNMRVGLKFWLTTSRLLWFMGFNKRGVESFKEAKRRAKAGAEFLAKDAHENGKSLLVSHGLLNHYLVKYLKEDGWMLVYDGGKKYLAQKVLVKYDN